MNFKEKILKHKKMLIGSAVSIVAGAIIGFNGMVAKADYDALISQKAQTTTKIEVVQKGLDEKNSSLATLQAAEYKLNSELSTLVSAREEKERIAKAEAERIEAEKLAEQNRIEAERKAEQDRIAKAEAQKANSNNDSSTTSNTNSNNGSSSQSTPIGQTVWKTETGKKYHNKSKCGNSKTSTQVTLDQAKSIGLTACKTCY